jgi:hypothetical protein
MILWFLNIRHLGTLFGMWFLTSAQQLFLLVLPRIDSVLTRVGLTGRSGARFFTTMHLGGRQWHWGPHRGRMGRHGE